MNAPAPAGGHTPGPWKFGGTGSCEVFGGVECKSICAVSFSPMMYANARLIASAPDLLAERDRLREALKRLENAACNGDNTEGDPCRLIVVKAELREAAKAARSVLAKGVK